MTVSVGVDVGGTFTDFLMLDSAAATFRTAKVPTTVDDRARGFLEGIDALAVAPGAIDWLVHGTTAGTNAVLERKSAPVGLITTAGFRDTLELGRRTRPKPYGLAGNFTPLIPRRHRREVAERIDAAGNVVVPLDEEAVRAQAAALLDAGIESVVIHFLHAYVNDAHEARAAAIVRQMWPNEHVVAGHEIIREVREFERASTAAIHAGIGPIVSRYIKSVATQLADRGFPGELLVMQANGGMLASSLVASQAVQTVMSGPAAGVLAAAAIAEAAGTPNIITGDMGGTSFDVALVVGGAPVISAEKDLAYSVPIRIPMIDIHTVGAGGGSLAKIDAAGMLRVGPESAGSTPGPIGYGRGGTEPTITDANFHLGRLNPDAVTGAGAAPLGAVREALDALGAPLGLDATGAAEAIIRIAIAELAGAIRLVSIEKGHDPRDFAYMPFGGAGPLHAVEIARELGIPKIVVPRFPGLTSALGCILADVRHDFVQTVNRPVAALDPAEIDAILAAQAKAGRDLLAREKVAVAEVRIVHEADLLYKGQTHVLRVPIDGERFDADAVLAAFADAYRTRFELEFPEMVPMLANVRTTLVGVRERVDLAVFAPAGGDLAAARRGTRRAYFDGAWHQAAIWAREALPADAVIEGPAIVEQADSTLVLDPGSRATVDRVGNLVVELM
ncbi:hydantoinase/oxoprolinase family protein [Acuticoccus sp. I52.16.1]|uniref:hydantoinase/oxoprolinase family protein n=1 Tax=Acuticoccus sp. I52.16.1 TaxID=2928472 RepID=UPI001FD4E0FA|nr:hydantoinase/oxoprolinase family protein [Acuticoccus sp. I52.16.1]UOM33545.1 hydantoinase/oxoprolinase family protein [Acuticoccus sp. I52.16.1]